MGNLNIIKQQIIEGGLRLVKEGLVSRTWGNISIKVDKEYMLITPSGVFYEDLNNDNIILVNYRNLKYEGKIKPSSEYTMHCEIYKARKELNAVIHTHQMNASTVAVAQREVPPILDDMAQLIGPSIRVTDYSLSATKRIAKKTVKALKGRNAALLANHGAVCVGRNLDEAFIVSQVLEKSCKAFIEAEFLGGAKSINKFQAYMMHQFYLKKYSKEAIKNK